MFITPDVYLGATRPGGGELGRCGFQDADRVDAATETDYGRPIGAGGRAGEGSREVTAAEPNAMGGGHCCEECGQVVVGLFEAAGLVNELSPRRW